LYGQRIPDTVNKRFTHSVILLIFNMSKLAHTQKKNPAAVSLGRLGGLKGGKARAKSLSPEHRSEIARNASSARMKVLSPQRRSEIARNAVVARWSKSK
jgi:hypothetical protein